MNNEYQTLSTPKTGIAFADWLNEKCNGWEVIDIRTIPGQNHYQVTMRRPKPNGGNLIQRYLRAMRFE